MTMETTAVLVGVIVFLIFYLIFYKRDKRFNLPPGPPVLPYIGTAYVFDVSMASLVLAKRRYGDATTMYFGPLRGVMLNTYELVREACVTKAADFSDRGNDLSFCIRKINPDMRGIINSDLHESLRHNRAATLAILRSLGVGRATMEERILEEARDLCKQLTSSQAQPLEPWHLLTCAVLNVLLHIMFNKRLNTTDERLAEIVRTTDDVIKCSYHQAYIDAFPYLRYVPPFSRTYAKLVEGDARMREIMWQYAQQVLDDFDEEDESTFIDYWTKQQQQRGTNGSDDVSDKDNLRYILRDFLIAGSETTTTSLRWTLLFLANRPELQERVHAQIASVVGLERQVRLADREALPLVEAFMWEIQRYNTIVPAALPHFTRRGAKLGAYDIPPCTIVVANLHAIHMNPEVFPKPRDFNPERFIDASTGKFVRHPHVIPFNIGKRSCLGELLARQELFLFTSALIQHFRFLPPEGVKRIDERGIVGFTHSPKSFKIRAVPR